MPTALAHCCLSSCLCFFVPLGLLYDILWNTHLFLFGRPVSEHKLLWQPSDCIIYFVLLTLLLHVGNKYDDDDD